MFQPGTTCSPATPVAGYLTSGLAADPAALVFPAGYRTFSETRDRGLGFSRRFWQGRRGDLVFGARLRLRWSTAG